jgi:hypothetical protein
VFVILIASIFGILGSYGVAWFGIRINTTANSRTSFAAMRIPDEDPDADDTSKSPAPVQKTVSAATTQTGTATFVSGSGVGIK